MRHGMTTDLLGGRCDLRGAGTLPPGAFGQISICLPAPGGGFCFRPKLQPQGVEAWLRGRARWLVPSKVDLPIQDKRIQLRLHERGVTAGDVKKFQGHILSQE